MATQMLARQIGLDERVEGLSLTKNSLTRSLRTDTTRRIASSSSPDSVSVTSACFVPYHPTLDSPTFLLCALSDSTLCLINTTNLSKTYLFDNGDENTAADHPQKQSLTADQPKTQVMVVSCVSVGDATGGTQRIVAYVYFEGWIRSAVLSVTDAGALKQLQRDKWAKVLALPDMPASSKDCQFLFAASPFSPLVLTFVSLGDTRCPSTPLPGPDGVQLGPAKMYNAVLSVHDDGTSTVSSQFARMTFPPCRTGTGVGPTVNSVISVNWLTESVVLFLQSNGVLTLVNAENMRAVAQASLFEHCRAGTVQAGSVAVSKRGNVALVAVLVEDTILLTFTAQLENRENTLPSRKRPRTDSIECQSLPSTLTLTPSPQSFCSEDIRIANITAFYAFSWIVAVTLESGAVIFVDALSMEVLCQKTMARTAPIQRTARSKDTTSSEAQFTLVQEKPLLIAVFDHNTATFSKSH